MKVLLGKNASALREGFTAAFVNTKGEYYRSAIREVRLRLGCFSYVGCLYNCLISARPVSFIEAKREALSFETAYIMRDLNPDTVSSDKWKYPREAVLEVKGRELAALIDSLPGGVYIFNGGFSRTVVLTHESTPAGRRCLLAESNE